MEKKSFTVSAEYSREDESGWLSFSKCFGSAKEALAEYDAAMKNPLTIRASLKIERHFVPRA